MTPRQNSPANPPHICPISGASIPAHRRFNYVNAEGTYGLFGAVLPNACVWISPWGNSRLQYIREAFERLDSLVSRRIPADAPFVLINDAGELKRMSLKARRFLVDWAKRQERLAGVIMCRVPLGFRLSIKLANRARIFPFELKESGDYSKVLRLAHSLLEHAERKATNGAGAPFPSREPSRAREPLQVAIADLVNFIGSLTLEGPATDSEFPSAAPRSPFGPLYQAIIRKQNELTRLLQEYEDLRIHQKLREAELLEKNAATAEINTTLKILLEKRERDREAVERRLANRISERVMTPVRRLNHQPLTERQRGVLDAIEIAVENLLSPMVFRLHQLDSAFTRKELVVAFLVRHGQTTRRVAALMGVSPRTIDTHRQGIRRKLELPKQKGGLQKYLQEIDRPLPPSVGIGPSPAATSESWQVPQPSQAPTPRTATGSTPAVGSGATADDTAVDWPPLPTSPIDVITNPRWACSSGEGLFKAQAALLEKQVLWLGLAGDPERADMDGLKQMINTVIASRYPRDPSLVLLQDCSRLKSAQPGLQYTAMQTIAGLQNLSGEVVCGLNAYVGIGYAFYRRQNLNPHPLQIATSIEEGVALALRMVKGLGGLTDRSDIATGSPVSYSDPLKLRSHTLQLVDLLEGDGNDFLFQMTELDPAHPLRPVYEALFVMRMDVEQLLNESRAALRTIEARQQDQAHQAAKLGEMNRYLKNLLETRRRDGERLHEQMQWNMAFVVDPLIEAFGHTLPGRDVLEGLRLLKVRMAELSGSLESRLSTVVWRLSDREMEIARCIRDGKTSRRIAAELDISRRTVETHRVHLRRKLGIHHEKANLRSYLLSLDI